MKKLLCLFSLIFISSNSFCLIYHNNSNWQSICALPKEKETKILNLEEEIRKALYFDFLHYNHDADITEIKNIDISNLKYQNQKIDIGRNQSQKNRPNLQDKYYNTMIFKNNSDEFLPFSTPSFSITATNVYTSQVKLGISTNFSVKFSAFNLSFYFSYNKANIKQRSVSHTSTSLAQTIIVPPHKTYKVITYLGSIENYINIFLEEDISGIVSAVITTKTGPYNYQKQIGEIFQSLVEFTNLPEGICIKDNDTIHFTGLANISSLVYESFYRNEYHVVDNE